MTILAVAQRGEAILNLTAQEVTESEFNTPWLNACADALNATMLANNGVGIAAPQVYISKRMIIVASRPNLRYPNAPEMDPIVMVNPEILTWSKEQVAGEEGCLSVANQRGQVSRSEEILVRYFSLDGVCIEKTFTGFPARIVQHEVDHLNGILFTEKL